MRRSGLGRAQRAGRPDWSANRNRGRAPPACAAPVPRPSPPAHRRRRGCGGAAWWPGRRGGGVPRCGYPRLYRKRSGRSTRRIVTWPPRRGRVAAPSVAAGVLLALSLPPWGWWPLGLAGAGLWYWRLGGLRLRARVWSGWLAGLGCYAVGLFWARAFNWYGAGG